MQKGIRAEGPHFKLSPELQKKVDEAVARMVGSPTMLDEIPDEEWGNWDDEGDIRVMSSEVLDLIASEYTPLEFAVISKLYDSGNDLEEWNVTYNLFGEGYIINEYALLSSFVDKA